MASNISKVDDESMVANETGKFDILKFSSNAIIFNPVVYSVHHRTFENAGCQMGIKNMSATMNALVKFFYDQTEISINHRIAMIRPGDVLQIEIAYLTKTTTAPAVSPRIVVVVVREETDFMLHDNDSDELSKRIQAALDDATGSNQYYKGLLPVRFNAYYQPS